ncbi:MAG: MarR family transcriptional regulator [Mycoplasmatales bacterium]|nr:MarR family transcriptional regulator [Mycoplasmatales bacterium]
MEDINLINRVFMEIKSKIREEELDAIRKYELPISDLQWNYLVWSVEKNKLTLTELAKTMGIQKGTLSNNLKALVNRGLITKRKLEGKKILIEPTGEGVRYIALHQKVRKKINKKLSTILTKEELEFLIEIGLKLKEEL